MSETIMQRDYKDPQCICENASYQDVTGCISPGDHAGSYNGQDAYNDMLVANEEEDTIVRRLTPLECSRLQGLPDGWVDIGEWIDSKGKNRKESDSSKYKAIGNGIALPFWNWMIKRISAQYETSPSLGSLFDGISCFPLLWARCNGVDSCKWACEIEEFPIAVSKKHFGDEETGRQGDIRDYL